MALPADFSKIFGSTATGGLTPIGDVNYAKGWEFVGSNPPTKNDFSYLQNLSDRKSQYLYKLIGGESGAPAIGIPFFWPSSVMPNTVMPEWSDMVFLKLNDATFSAETYPKLALVWPGLKLTDTRGEFIRIWDDGRGVDTGRELLSAQGDAIRNITGWFGAHATVVAKPPFVRFSAPEIAENVGVGGGSTNNAVKLDLSLSGPTASENRPRSIAFNFIVRAK